MTSGGDKLEVTLKLSKDTNEERYAAMRMLRKIAARITTILAA